MARNISRASRIRRLKVNRWEIRRAFWPHSPLCSPLRRLMPSRTANYRLGLANAEILSPFPGSHRHRLAEVRLFRKCAARGVNAWRSSVEACMERTPLRGEALALHNAISGPPAVGSSPSGAPELFSRSRVRPGIFLLWRAVRTAVVAYRVSSPPSRADVSACDKQTAGLADCFTHLLPLGAPVPGAAQPFHRLLVQVIALIH